MTFENFAVLRTENSGRESDDLFRVDAESLLRTAPSAEAKLKNAGWEAFFGTPVIDSRLAPQQTQPDIFGVYDDFKPDAESLEACGNFPRTTNKKDSLEETAKGNSILNRMYEVAVLTPAGKTADKDFDSVYGTLAAGKMKELGITQVSRSGDRVTARLKAPLHFEGGSGSIDIGTTVSFDSAPRGGAVTLDRVQGVTARSGLFQVAIDQVELEPRQKGYLSGLVVADWSRTRVCAFPDGKIYR